MCARLLAVFPQQQAGDQNICLRHVSIEADRRVSWSFGSFFVCALQQYLPELILFVRGMGQRAHSIHDGGLTLQFGTRQLLAV